MLFHKIRCIMHTVQCRANCIVHFCIGFIKLTHKDYTDSWCNGWTLAFLNFSLNIFVGFLVLRMMAAVTMITVTTVNKIGKPKLCTIGTFLAFSSSSSWIDFDFLHFLLSSRSFWKNNCILSLSNLFSPLEFFVIFAIGNCCVTSKKRCQTIKHINQLFIGWIRGKLLNHNSSKKNYFKNVNDVSLVSDEF